MKKKANGTFQARLNAKWYDQVEGVPYDGSTIALTATNDTEIMIIILLTLIAGWVGNIVDVKGAFLHCEF